MNIERKAETAWATATQLRECAGTSGEMDSVVTPVATDHASAFIRISSSSAIPISTFRPSSNRTRHAAESTVRLTPREADVLRLLARGATYSQVSDRFGVSPNTVASHVKNIYRKLEVHSARAAVWRALELRLLGDSDGASAVAS
jgi:DNA-binding CsgD family transcriptional regulator